jgi:hypothetical protein
MLPFSECTQGIVFMTSGQFPEQNQNQNLPYFFQVGTGEKNTDAQGRLMFEPSSRDTEERSNQSNPLKRHFRLSS